MSIVYVSPLGGGNNSGSSADNALPFSALDSAIENAGPGGTVMLLADLGPYQTTQPLIIGSGGSADAPVTIKGVDSFGNAMDVQIHGTRAPIYTPGMLEKGNDVFVLADGADNLVFEGMDFFNVGTAFHFAADISNIVIQNVDADNVRLFAGHYLQDAFASATVSGLIIRDVEVRGFSYGVITLKYDTNNVVIERVFGDSEYQDKDGITEGVHLTGTVHDVLIKDTTMMNCMRTGSYYNGDGFATERDVYDVRFENTVASGNGDGGYDLKSTSTVLVNAIAEDNGRNFRIWGEVTLIDAVGIDPHKRGGSGGQYQIQILDGAQVTVTGGWFVDSGSSTTVVRTEGNGEVDFIGSHFVYAAKLTVGSNIRGIDNARALLTPATGTYSTNAEIYVGGEIVPPPPDPVLTGTSGNDLLETATDQNWTVNGLAGNDTITTRAGNDLIFGGGGNDVISAGAGQDVIRVTGSADGLDRIDGGAGVDRIEAGAKGTVIGLTSLTGVEAISSNGFGSVTISGSSAADTLDFTTVTLTGITAIKGAAGNDTIYGGAGNDMIVGGAGADVLRGNAGADRFDFNVSSESRGSTIDRILDFQPGSDKLDLAGVDASSTASGNQAFSFIGQAAFSKRAGELRIDTTQSAKTIVMGDTNGDGVADFVIELVGTVQLNSSDFVL